MTTMLIGYQGRPQNGVRWSSHVFYDGAQFGLHGFRILGLGSFFFRHDRFSKKNKLGEKRARWFLIIVSPCCQTYGSDFMVTIEQRATFGNVKVIF
jgi:hypothetical protein